MPSTLAFFIGLSSIFSVLHSTAQSANSMTFSTSKSFSSFCIAVSFLHFGDYAKTMTTRAWILLRQFRKVYPRGFTGFPIFFM